MKKTFICSLAAITAVLLFTQIPSAEARGYHNTRVQVNVGNAYRTPETCVVRRYARPVIVPGPVYAAPPAYYYRPYCAPVCVPAPVYVYPAPVYVEEVYVAPRPRPFGFGGLSFSWNFFK